MSIIIFQNLLFDTKQEYLGVPHELKFICWKKSVSYNLFLKIKFSQFVSLLTK
jgi:hypothetical protein